MTSTLITIAEIEELVQSGLPTRALERYIDAADASIVELYGPHSGVRTVTLRGNRARPPHAAGYHARAAGEWRLHLPYPWAAEVVQVAEYSERQRERDARAVDAARWALELGGRALRRLDRPWRPFVAVRYTPIDDRTQRTLLLIDLTKLSVRYDAVSSSAIGPRGTGVAVNHLDYERERKKLLRRLMPNRPGSLIA